MSKSVKIRQRFLGNGLAILGMIVLISPISGCSWIKNRRSVFNSESNEPQTVPKEQYDQLLEKYQVLLKNQNGETPVAEATPGQTGESERVELVDELNKVGPGIGDLVETVDVFPNAASGMSEKSTADESIINTDLAKLKQGRNLALKNQYDAALKILKELEASKVRPVRAHAKYLIGELLFSQGEFDLSMQVFEDLIQKEASSHLVIQALGRLVVCSDKLKQKQKKDRYYSMLHDFFGDSKASQN